MEQILPNPNHCEGVEHIEQNKCYKDGMEVKEQSPDSSEEIVHANDRVQHSDQNKNLKEGKDKEQNLNHSEGMDIPKQAIRYSTRRSKSIPENIQQLDQYGSEQTEQHIETNVINGELENHEGIHNQAKEIKMQKNENNLSTIENDSENRQDESAGRKRKRRISQAVQRYGNIVVDPDGPDTGSDMRDSDDDPEFTANEKNGTVSDEEEEESGLGSTRGSSARDNSDEKSKIDLPIACPHCPRRFKVNSVLVKHLAYHKTKDFSCPKCCRLFRSDKLLRIHHLFHRNTDKVGPFCCPHCSREFGTKYSWQRHVFDHEKEDSEYLHACHACKTCFKSDKQFRRHRFKNHREEIVKENKAIVKEKEASKQIEVKMTFICPHCNKELGINGRNKHLETHNEAREKNYLCSYCNKAFYNQYHLAKHELMHTDIDRPFICQHCEMRFKVKKDLVAHKRRCKKFKKKVRDKKLNKKVPNSRTHLCSVCNKGFFYKVTLNRHEKKYHKLSHRCRKCKKNFISKKNLVKHQVVHMEKKNVCNICKRNFISKDELKKHKISHTVRCLRDSNTCTECKEVFDSRNALREHRLLHNIEKIENNYSIKLSFKSNKVIQNGANCSICQKTFSKSSNLKKHMKIHSAENCDNHCPICQKNFSSRGTLTVHMKIHSGEKHHCAICKRTFNRISSLTRHMKIHSGGETMFTCHVCDKTFTHKSNQEAHLRSHLDIEEAYLCSECLKIFASRASLKEHIEAVHVEDKLYPCPLCPMKFAHKHIMQKHFLSHRGEEVLSCPHCPKYYESQEDTNWHIIRSHQAIVHKFSYRDEFYYNLRILEEDPKNIDKNEPESSTNSKSKMEKINQNTIKMRKKKCKQTLDERGNLSMDKENSLQDCSVMLNHQYTYSGIDDRPLTLWL